MTSTLSAHARTSWTAVYRFFALPFVVGVLGVTGCASGSGTAGPATATLAAAAAGGP